MSDTMISRRMMLNALLVASASVCVPLAAHAFDGTPQSGTYGARHQNGNMVVYSVVYGEGSIRMTLQAMGAGQANSSLYSPVGGGRYQASNGATIMLTSQQSFVWVNANGRNRLAYNRLN